MNYAFFLFSLAMEALNSVHPYLDPDMEDLISLANLALGTLLDEVFKYPYRNFLDKVIHTIRYLARVTRNVQQCNYWLS